MNGKRMLADIIIFIAAFTAPWWIVFILAGMCLFIFEEYYEILFVGFIIDSLYGVKLTWLTLPSVYLLIAAILFIIMNILKRRLKFDF
jgi:predicted anti-sigma-YlaC factor YlaD